MARKEQKPQKEKKEQPAPKKGPRRKRSGKRIDKEKLTLRAVEKFSARIEEERAHRSERIRQQEYLVNRNPSAVLDREGMERLRKNLAVSAPVRAVKSLL